MGVRIANRAPQFLPGTIITDAFRQAIYALGPMVTPMGFDGVIVNNSCLAAFAGLLKCQPLLLCRRNSQSEATKSAKA